MTQPRYSKVTSWEKNKVIRVITNLKNNSEQTRIELTENSKEADIIVMLESCMVKTPKYKKMLLEEDVVKLRPFRVYTINYEDKPLGLLPGIYSSLELDQFNKKNHLSWPHLDFPNNYVDIYAGNNMLEQNSFLFTFSGSCSHPLRNILFSAYPEESNLYKIVEVKKWYDHSEDEKDNYVKDILSCKYVLCPRGIASYSHRIIETIALGRVPVIIADNWVPFSIPETGYYLKINENDIFAIPEILKKWEPWYEEMVKNVKTVYRKYFDQGKRYSIAILKIIELHSRINSNNI